MMIVCFYKVTSFHYPGSRASGFKASVFQPSPSSVHMLKYPQAKYRTPHGPYGQINVYEGKNRKTAV